MRRYVRYEALCSLRHVMTPYGKENLPVSYLHFSLFAQRELQSSPLSIVSVILFLNNSKEAHWSTRRVCS